MFKKCFVFEIHILNNQALLRKPQVYTTSHIFLNANIVGSMKLLSKNKQMFNDVS